MAAQNAKCAPLNFIDEEVHGVINKAKSSKSICSDGISLLILKQLDPTGVKVSKKTKVLNLPLKTLHKSDMWKIGRVVPLLKPGKPGKPANL